MEKKVKYQVNLSPPDGVIPSEEEMLELMEDAGWTDDPGSGTTVLIPNDAGTPAYEVFCPIPFAPPIGWEPTPPLDELIRQRVKREWDLLKDEEEIDDIVDAEDFDIPDELPDLSTIYEVMGMEEEYPREPKVEVTREQRIKDELDYEELKDRESRLRKRRARIEYDRRRSEEEELYGPSEAVRGAVQRAEEEGA